MSHNAAGDNAGPADDLTRIGGIGSKIAHRLAAAGIRTYSDLASRSAGEIAEVLPDVSGLSTARIDGWRRQARQLAAAIPQEPATVPGPRKAGAVTAPPDSGLSADGDNQYELSFLVRVLVNEDNSIRRTIAQRVGTGEPERWAGWAGEKLLNYIATSATSGAHEITPAPPAPPETPRTEPARAVAEPGESLPELQPREQAPLVAPTGGATATGEQGAEPLAIQRLAPIIGLSADRTVVRAREPIAMTMSLDLAGATVTAERLAYSAVVAARPLAGGSKRTLAHTEGLLATEKPTVRIEAEGLPPGIYRIEAAVSLREQGASRPAGLAALVEGLMLQVVGG